MEKQNKTPKPINVDAAIRHYKNHLKCVETYRVNHPEQMRAKAMRAYNRIKEDPERLAKMKEQKRLYYLNVIKPKNLAKLLPKVDDATDA